MLTFSSGLAAATYAAANTTAASCLLLRLLMLFYAAVCCSCSAWTNKLITAKDHASVQLNIGHLNEEGIYSGNFTTFALAGKVRAQVGAQQQQHGARQGGFCLRATAAAVAVLWGRSVS